VVEEAFTLRNGNEDDLVVNSTFDAFHIMPREGLTDWS
jgi:hypothetical protein